MLKNSFVAILILMQFSGVGVLSQAHAATPPSDRPALEKEARELKDEAIHAQDAAEHFQSFCFDPKLNVLPQTAVMDTKLLRSGTLPPVCEDEAEKLGKKFQELEARKKILEKKSNLKVCSTCSTDIQKVSGLNTTHTSLDNLSTQAGETNSCSVEEKAKLTVSSCLKDDMCSLMRGSMFGVAYKLEQELVKSGKGKPSNSFESCMDSKGKGDCGTEMMEGLMKDLWSNFDMVKEGGKWIKGKLIDGYSWLIGAENKSSTAAHLASQQSPGMIAQFRAHPVDFTLSMVKNIYQMMTQAIREDYGCQKWSGPAHVKGSVCLKPMDNWDCADCGAKVNAICGVGGAMVGELAVAYVTGGMASTGKVMLKEGIQNGSKFARIIGRAMEPAVTAIKESKAAKAAADLAAQAGKSKYGRAALMAKFAAEEAVLGTVDASVKAVKSVIEHPVSQALMDYAASGGKKVAAATRAVAKSSVGTAAKVTFKVAKVGASPVTEYMGLMDKAFMKGFEDAGTVGRTIQNVARAANGMKALEAERAAKAARALHVQTTENALEGVKNFDVIVDAPVTKGGQESVEFVSHEPLYDVETKLKNSHTRYKVETGPDGKIKLEVELPPRCINGDAGNFLTITGA